MQRYEDLFILANFLKEKCSFGIPFLVIFIENGIWQRSESMGSTLHYMPPYTNITKSDIARIGKQLDIDYTETWSCYKGGTHHCGKCGTCQERKEALAEAGITDKTIYLE